MEGVFCKFLKVLEKCLKSAQKRYEELTPRLPLV